MELHLWINHQLPLKIKSINGAEKTQCIYLRFLLKNEDYKVLMLNIFQQKTGTETIFRVTVHS